MLNGEESGEHQQPRALSSWRETAELEKDLHQIIPETSRNTGEGSPWCCEDALNPEQGEATVKNTLLLVSWIIH